MQPTTPNGAPVTAAHGGWPQGAVQVQQRRGTGNPPHRPPQRFRRDFTYGQAAVFIFGIVLPAIGLIWSGIDVFSDAKLVTTIMVLVTVGASAILLYYGSSQSDRVRRFCLVAELILSVIMWANLGVHLWIAREVSSAKSGVQERHVEEDRQAKLQSDANAQELELERARTEREKAERQKLREIPWNQRKKMPAAKVTPTPAAAVAATPTPATAGAGNEAAEAEDVGPSLTPDQVRRKYSALAWFFAFLEAGVAILSLGIMTVMHHWDMKTDADNNGVPDWIQTQLTWEEIRQRYPQYYAILMAQQQGAQPGMAGGPAGNP